MIPDWTFGVELEFVVAETVPGEPHPDPSETRFTQFQKFKPYRGRLEELQELRNDTASILAKTTRIVLKHMRRTMTVAGFKVREKDKRIAADISKWEIKQDGSIDPPMEVKGWDRGYVWHKIEVISPAYFFCPESLMAIAELCSLLTSTYCCNVNMSTGLHVHVGTGTKAGPSFDTVRKLAAFLWTFSPQLASLHPADRQGNAPSRYFGGMREASQLVMRRKRPNKSRATPGLGAAKLLLAESMEKILDFVCAPCDKRSVAYNFENLRTDADGIPIRGAIEFRQHTGSLDGLAITTWIKTVVGIVDFVHRVPPAIFNDLIRTATENEVWQMLYNGEDAQKMETHGPILAQSGLTIIDLLRYMELHGPANFYQARGLFFPQTEGPPGPGDGWISDWDYAAQYAAQYGGQSAWKFEDEGEESKMNPAVKNRNRLLKEVFGALDKITRIQRVKGKSNIRDPKIFDSTASYWPSHKKHLDDSIATDDSSNYNSDEPSPDTSSQGRSDQQGSDEDIKEQGDTRENSHNRQNNSHSRDANDSKGKDKGKVNANHEIIRALRAKEIIDMLKQIQSNDYKIQQLENLAGDAPPRLRKKHGDFISKPHGDSAINRNADNPLLMALVKGRFEIKSESMESVCARANNSFGYLLSLSDASEPPKREAEDASISNSQEGNSSVEAKAREIQAVALTIELNDIIADEDTALRIDRWRRSMSTFPFSDAELAGLGIRRRSEGQDVDVSMSLKYNFPPNVHLCVAEDPTCQKK
jgi:hypothetical protein